jgi:GT2 family glycosyltransferase
VRLIGSLLALTLLPLIWLYAFALTGLALFVDVLARPFTGRRHLPDDCPVATRNASVIILNWNGVDFLRDLLPSVQVAVERADGDHEVIVVDNGSDDGSAEFVAQEHSWVGLVRLPRNLYFIEGNRAGVRAATRDILVFLNNDMRVEPDFLVNLLAPFGPADLFAVTARIETEGGSEETGRTRGIFTRSQLYHVRAELDGELVPVLWAGGGSSAFDRAKYLELGGFESLFQPCYVEDVSLSYQAWRRGWRCLYRSDAVTHHVRRGTTNRVFGERGVERLQRRNLELFFWRSVTNPIILLMRALFLPWDVLKDARRTGLVVQCSALLSVLLRFPRAMMERQRSRSRHRFSDREVLRRSCHVSLHRRAMVPRTAAGPTLLVVGAGQCLLDLGNGIRVVRAALTPPEIEDPPQEDLFGLLPRRFWSVARNGPFRDRVRDLLAETDYDLVLFEDLWALASAQPYLANVDSLLWLEDLPDESAFLERARRDRLLSRLARRTRAVITGRVEIAERLRRAGCRVVEPPGFAQLVAELHKPVGDP